jgi:hypothetical protein
MCFRGKALLFLLADEILTGKYNGGNKATIPSPEGSNRISEPKESRGGFTLQTTPYN